MRAEQKVKELSENVGAEATPAVVWLYTPADDKSVTALESKVFRNERVGLAMKKFRCYRVNVEEIENREIREEYLRAAPAFLFFDPAGEQVSELDGKRATSLSDFSKHLGKTWDQSFTMRLKVYVKKMTEILNRLDKFTGQEQVLAQSKARLDSKPNALKSRKLQADAEALQAEKEEILEDEKELLASVELRPEFRPEEQAALDR